jgi:hypothetical protein
LRVVTRARSALGPRADAPAARGAPAAPGRHGAGGDRAPGQRLRLGFSSLLGFFEIAVPAALV